MDSLTQIVLGGAVGEAVLGKKVGNKAILWGAIGGTIPDLDTIPGQFMDTVDRLEIHRGFSHSIIFAILAAPILAYLLKFIYRKGKYDYWAWTQLFFWSIFTHPLLDIFTTWGTQLFWPLDWRIAIQSIFVIDPLYTLPFLICLLIVLFLKRESRLRAKLNLLGITLSSIYLAWSVGAKWYVNTVFEDAFTKDLIQVHRYESRPTVFNTLLWTANVETKDEFLITYYSLLDKDEQLIYQKFKKQHDLLNPYRNNSDIERLIALTKGYYLIEATEEGNLLMHDLRFGLTEGFDNGKGQFVFTYQISTENGEVMIKQLPNSFKEMDGVIAKTWKRIKGFKYS